MAHHLNDRYACSRRGFTCGKSVRFPRQSPLRTSWRSDIGCRRSGARILLSWRSYPEAVSYGKELNVEAFRDARWISEPFRLFDCSRENDGAGAFLMVSAERARDMKKPPLSICSACANGAEKGWGDLLENDDEDLMRLPGSGQYIKPLYADTGLSPDQIDVVQLYENFSAQGIASLIDHGFCTYENVAEVVRFENLIAPTGKLPINTGGGNFAQGFVHGIGTAIETVKQLRGESSQSRAGCKNMLACGRAWITHG